MSIYIFKFSDSFIKDRVKGNKDNEEYTEKSEKVKESSEYSFSAFVEIHLYYNVLT